VEGLLPSVHLAIHTASQQIKAKGYPVVGWLHHLPSNSSTACKYKSIMQVMQILHLHIC